MKREQFKLRKVKIEKKTVTIDYNIIGNDDDDQKVSPRVPHPDLKSALAKLKPLMCQVFDMPDGNDEKFVINGVVISEKKNDEQIMVLSTFTTMSGSRVAMNTPNISTGTDHWETQATLGEDIDKVVDECYEYLFNSKAAQQELPLESTDDDEKEPELELNDEETK
jgi:hypothetical protein